MSESAQGDMRTMAALAPPAQGGRQISTLAYEHSISIETAHDALPTRLREIEAACNADRTSNCTVLTVSLQSNRDHPSGSIQMRLAPGGVEPIITLASRDGAVTSRNTRAENLAEPIADTERHIALLTLHRDRLTEFMKSKEIKIDGHSRTSVPAQTTASASMSFGAATSDAR